MKRSLWRRAAADANLSTIALAAMIAACVTDGPEGAVCDTGLKCPAGWLCTSEGNGCYPATCGDDVVDRSNGELCDDGNTESGDGCSEYCLVLENCGDGKPDPGETCDDGNTVSGDGCSKDCQSTETCGDSVVNPGEQCDEGKETATCDDDCTLPRCGDGTLNERFINPTTGLAEYCDDGLDTSSCDADCSPVECGDGLHNTGATGDKAEECDDGENDVFTDDCLPGCKQATCGDDFTLQGVEDCDEGMNPDGTRTESQSCDSDCTLPICGDGYLNIAAGEACDDGNDSVLDACPSGAPGLCQRARCGDGFLEFGREQCDDGNDIKTDACPSGPPDDDKPTCRLTRCGDGYVNAAAGEICDDGNGDNTDACPDGIGGTCQPARCGDGFKADDEPCDTSGIDTVSCNADCTIPDCGDGHVNRAAAEDCDDGNRSNNDDCPDGVGGTCQPARCGDGFSQTGVEGCDDGNRNNNDDCPDGIGGTCQPARCGDGFRNENPIDPTDEEACDDGNGIDFDACPGTCEDAQCGDGFVYLGVEVCDDGDELNTDACPDGPGGTCEPARCGDGFVHEDVEGCESDSDCGPGRDCPTDGSNPCQCA